MSGIKKFIEIIKSAFKIWSEEKASRLAAALAFYTALSLAPMLIFTVAIVGLVISGNEAQDAIVGQASDALGESSGELIAGIIENASDPGASIIASIISLAAVLWGASNLFNQLQLAFNEIWDVPNEKLKGLVTFVVMRLKALGMVFGIGLMLILTMAISVVVQAVKTFVINNTDEVAELLPGVDYSQLSWLVSNILPLVDILVSLLVLALVFAWMFRAIPHVDNLKWKDVRGGAILTAVLFIVGKFGLAIYLAGGSVGAAYGAAGSLLVILVWVYYSGQILFLGVAYCVAYARLFGSFNQGVAVSAESDSNLEPDNQQSVVPSPVLSAQTENKLPQPKGPDLKPVATLLAPVAIFTAGIVSALRGSNR